jgi:hypothetical protein
MQLAPLQRGLLGRGGGERAGGATSRGVFAAVRGGTVQVERT